MQGNDKKEKSSGILGLLFCGIAGIAAGIGGKLLYDEITKDEKELENKRLEELQRLRGQLKNNKNQNEGETNENLETSCDAEYEAFFCPISQEVMKDPVITPDGISYERISIISWLKNNNTCPITKNCLKETELITNYALKNTIDDYLRKVKR